MRKQNTTSNENRVMKPFEELEFRDDFMFGKVMEDPELCRRVLERLLDTPVGELTAVEAQKEFRYFSDGKPIRLDIYNMDDTGTVFDTEIQNLNKKSVEFYQLPKRSRFYQSAIDTDFLRKKMSYKKLPESRIIFICTFDPFGKGKPRYTFTEKCEEVNDLGLGDGTQKIFFNTTYTGDDIGEELKNLFRYIETEEVTDTLTKELDSAVIEGRKREIWRSEYMKEWVIIEDAREEGREEERENTERERERADAESKRADVESKRADSESKRADIATSELEKYKAFFGELQRSQQA